MKKSKVVFPFEKRGSLPNEPYLRACARILLREIKRSMNPHLLSEVRYYTKATSRILSIHFSYDRQGVSEAIRTLKKHAFLPVLNDESENRPAWMSLQKRFEVRGLVFLAEINCAPQNPRAQLRISVRIAPALL